MRQRQAGERQAGHRRGGTTISAAADRSSGHASRNGAAARQAVYGRSTVEHVVQRATTTTTAAEAYSFDTESPIVEVVHSRGANAPSTGVPGDQVDSGAVDKTLRHYMPYNLIRDVLTSRIGGGNRPAALEDLSKRAGALAIEPPNYDPRSGLGGYHAAVDQLYGAIGMWGGNLFVADGSSGDRGGKAFDEPPPGELAESVHRHAEQFQAVLGLQEGAPRRRFTGRAQFGTSDAPIVIN